MLLSKENLSLIAAANAPGKNDSYLPLDYIMVDPAAGEVIASNGHSLYFSQLPLESDDDYPDTGTAGAVPSKECILLPVGALMKAAKALPVKPSVHILRHVQVLTDETQHHLITTDLEYANDIKVRHSQDRRVSGDSEEIGKNRNFPDVESIRRNFADIPSKAVVGLSIAALETLIKVAKGHGATIVRFEVAGATNPVKVSAEDGAGGLSGYIMPCALAAMPEAEAEAAEADASERAEAVEN